MPPKDQDDNLELDPSVSSEMDDASDPQDSGKEVDASSSDATGVTEEKSALDVVREVVDARKEPSEAASPAEGSETGDDAGGKQTTKEPDDEAFSDVPFHKHPRFKQLLQQRDGFRDDAGRYQNVQQFLTDNNLSAEEAADGMSIMALAKSNPAEAWSRMKPWVQKILVAAGEVLPGDLDEAVGRGEISRDRAIELSRTRAQVSSAQTQQEFQRQQNERRQQENLRNDLTGTAHSWEADRRLKDPNFEAKIEPLMKELAWIQSREGKPNTPDGVRAQLKTAYDAVNAAFKPAPAPAARRPAIRPVTGGSVAGQTAPAPNSTLDIIQSVVARRAG